MTEVLWTPSEAAIGQTRMTAFTDWLSQRTGLTFSDYDTLQRWSTEHWKLWEAYLDCAGIITHAPATRQCAHHARCTLV
jgi:acetoacetyl-CoA synthetase